MTQPDSLHTPPLSPERILQRFLASRGIDIPLGQCAGVCAAVDVANGNKTNRIARRLEDQLEKLGIKLKHTHALEAVSQITGHHSYIRSLKRTSGGRPVYVAFLTLEGEEFDSSTHLNVSDTVTAALDWAVWLMPDRAEPALCIFSKQPSGFTLDVRQQSSPWFEIFVACFREDSLPPRSPIPVWLDEDELRTAFHRVAESLEKAHPALLVNGGAVPHSVKPWCKAWFRMTSMQDAKQFSVVDERGLFQFLDSTQCKELTTKDGFAVAQGPKGLTKIEPSWVDEIPIGELKIYEVDAEDTAKDVWRRYLRYQNALTGTVATALANIVGRVDYTWATEVDNEAILALMRQRGYDARKLAFMAGLRFSDIKALDDLRFVPPELVVQIAAALEIEPDRLLVSERHLTPTPVLDANLFIRSACAATQFIISFGDSLPPDEMEDAALLLSQAIDIAIRISAASTPDVQNIAKQHRIVSDAESAVDDLLVRATNSGILFVLFHDVRFVRSNAAASSEAAFQPINKLRIQAERRDEGQLNSFLAARW